MEIAKSLDNLLIEAVELGGSDLHLSVGAQPRTRIHGNLKNMNYAIISPKNANDSIDLNNMIEILTKNSKRKNSI